MAPRSKRKHARTPYRAEGGGDEAKPEWDDSLAKAEDVREGEAQFTRYYRDAQRICRDADDWQAFMASLHTPLPVSFRLSSQTSRQAEVARALEQALPLLSASHPLGARGTRSAPPARQFTGLSGLAAWQLGCGCDAKAIRQAAKHAPDSALAALGRWLIAQNAAGVLTRQEIVSMIPVALLDVRPGHSVLDLCAAPGSKSTQVLESLLSPPPVPAARAGQAAATAHAVAPGSSREQGGPAALSLARGGLLVANELDSDRSHTLASRCSALGAACASLVVTVQRAQTFPLPDGVRFDRVVCDVPCSGDATFRKYPDKWAHYQPHIGRTLHALQLQIALRGARALREGGVLAYSTCSLNPIEDEAVVAGLIRATGGALELLDCARRLHGQMAVRPGHTDWAVLDDAGVAQPSCQAARAAARARASDCAARYRASMWPAGAAGNDLRRCVRVMPHDNDTGGFFIALLRKRAPWPPLDPARAPRRPQLPPVVARAQPDAALGAQADATGVRALAPPEVTALRLAAPALRPLLDALGAAVLGGEGSWLALCERLPARARERGPSRLFLCTASAALVVGALPLAVGDARGPSGQAATRADRPLRAIAIGACVAVRRRGRGSRARRAPGAPDAEPVPAPERQWALTPLGARLAKPAAQTQAGALAQA